jgi:alpha-mannosidase
VMNNYWTTNYRHDQDGPVTFRYAIRPHGPYEASAAARFGAECSQPLVVLPVDQETPQRPSLVTVQPDDVIVSALKPSRDGKAWIVRLFGAGGRAARARLRWSPPAPRSVWLSNLAEGPELQITGEIEVPAFGMVTLRAELPQ